MKYLNIAVIVIIGAILFSCGSGKVLMEKTATAKSSFSTGDYNEALAKYEEIIEIYKNNSNEDDCPVYTNAGIAAYETGDFKKAINYFKKDEYSEFKTGTTFYFLALSYSKIDNLSLEMLALQDYKESYRSGEYISDINMRLFDLYVATDNYEKALSLWPTVSYNRENDIELVEKYFSIYVGLNNADSCAAIARRMLRIDGKNETALLWFGKQYYRKAEDKYQLEIKAYNNNKTNKQYKKLLTALDAVTNDFKKSLGYFKKLYTEYPKPEYANYLSHIYNRLSDEKKSDYYSKLAGK